MSVSKKRAAPKPPKHEPSPTINTEKAAENDKPASTKHEIADSNDNTDILLKIFMPDKTTNEITVPSSTVLMDLRMQLCARYKLSPSSYIIEPIENDGKVIAHHSSSVIGSLSCEAVAIKSKAKEPVKITPPKVVEQTVRLTIKMSRSNQQVIRVNPTKTLSQLMPSILEKSGIKSENHPFLELRHPDQKTMALDVSRSLNDYKIKEVFLADKRVQYDIPPEIPESPDKENTSVGKVGSEKKSKKLKSFFRLSKRHKQAPTPKSPPPETKGSGSSSPPAPVQAQEALPQEPAKKIKTANTNESNSKSREETAPKKHSAPEIPADDSQTKPVPSQVSENINGHTQEEKADDEISVPVENEKEKEVAEDHEIQKNSKNMPVPPRPKAPPRTKQKTPIATSRPHTAGKKKAPPPPPGLLSENDPPSPKPRPLKPPRKQSVKSSEGSDEKVVVEKKAVVDEETIDSAAQNQDEIEESVEEAESHKTSEDISPQVEKDEEKIEEIETKTPEKVEETEDVPTPLDEGEEIMRDIEEIVNIESLKDVVEQVKDDEDKIEVAEETKEVEAEVVEVPVSEEPPSPPAEPAVPEMATTAANVEEKPSDEELEAVIPASKVEEIKEIVVDAKEKIDAPENEQELIQDENIVDLEQIQVYVEEVDMEGPKSPPPSPNLEKEDIQLELQNVESIDVKVEAEESKAVEEPTRIEEPEEVIVPPPTQPEKPEDVLPPPHEDLTQQEDHVEDEIIHPKKIVDPDFGQSPANDDFDFMSSDRQPEEGNQVLDVKEEKHEQDDVEKFVIYEEKYFPPPPPVEQLQEAQEEKILESKEKEKLPDKEEDPVAEDDDDDEYEDDETAQEIKKLREQINRMRRKKAAKQAQEEAARQKPFTIVDEKRDGQSGDGPKSGSKTFTFVPNQHKKKNVLYEDYEIAPSVGINLSASGEIQRHGEPAVYEDEPMKTEKMIAEHVKINDEPPTPIPGPSSTPVVNQDEALPGPDITARAIVEPSDGIFFENEKEKSSGGSPKPDITARAIVEPSDGIFFENEKEKSSGGSPKPDITARAIVEPPEVTLIQNEKEKGTGSLPVPDRTARAIVEPSDAIFFENEKEKSSGGSPKPEITARAIVEPPDVTLIENEKEKSSGGYVTSAVKRQTSAESSVAPAKPVVLRQNNKDKKQDPNIRKSALPNYYKRFLGVQALRSAIEDTEKQKSQAIPKTDNSKTGENPQKETLSGSDSVDSVSLEKEMTQLPPPREENRTSPIKERRPPPVENIIIIEETSTLPPPKSINENRIKSPDDKKDLDDGPLPPPPKEFSSPNETPSSMTPSSPASPNATSPTVRSPISPNYIGLSSAKPFNASSGPMKNKFRPMSANFKDDANLLHPVNDSNVYGGNIENHSRRSTGYKAEKSPPPKPDAN